MMELLRHKAEAKYAISLHLQELQEVRVVPIERVKTTNIQVNDSRSM